MLRKFISVLCVFLGISAAAYAGPAANIEYIHNAVREKWGVELTTTANPRMVANMEYLLAAVDVVNEYLNGYPVHRPEWKKYATHQVADTIATDFAVSELIGLEWPFEITTTEISSGDTFEYMLGAAGEFMVDWGDGTVEKIDRNTTELGIYSHTYETAGTYKIKFRGHATGYEIIDLETAGMWSAIVFEGNYMIASISGSLGSIFGTLPDGTNPTFLFTFAGCENLTSIPETLFAGISGAPTVAMFYATFDGCIGLTSIPENLFAGISGTPAAYMFDSTFYGCSGLTSIPNNIFAKISGVPAERMFAGTFFGCVGLKTIPENLFAGISGAPAYGMFGDTFYGCTGLTSIPENLFGDISGPAVPDMFAYMFDGCTGLTGPSAKIGGKYLYEIWPDATAEHVGNMYKYCTGLSDYCDIPGIWGGPLGPNCTAELPKPPTNWPFVISTVEGVNRWGFYLGAVGTFWVDWGDGTVEKIDSSSTTRTWYAHEYKTPGKRTVKLGGRATGYSEGVAVIGFTSQYSYITTMSGSLGQIFPTLPDGTNPCFANTFSGQVNMTTVHNGLFSGIYGQPVRDMFRNTFSNCWMLHYIGDGLFSGLSGVPAEGMFDGTFSNSSGITSIPENLFGNISGPAVARMFVDTFASTGGTVAITGPSAKIGGKYLYEIWPDATAEQVGGMYQYCTRLTDYADIPAVWK